MHNGHMTARPQPGRDESGLDGTPLGSMGPSSPAGGDDGPNPSPDAGEDDDPDSDSACFAQLKFRSVEDNRARVVGATHAFWWVQDRRGSQAIISAGPQRGLLRIWVVPGDTNGLGNKSQTTHFSTLVSSVVCDSVDRMLATAGSFPGSSIRYSPFWQNSNSAARHVGEAGGLILSAPPGPIGLDVSLVTRPDPITRPRVSSYANR